MANVAARSNGSRRRSRRVEASSSSRSSYLRPRESTFPGNAKSLNPIWRFRPTDDRVTIEIPSKKRRHRWFRRNRRLGARERAVVCSCSNTDAVLLRERRKEPPFTRDTRARASTTLRLRSFIKISAFLEAEPLTALTGEIRETMKRFLDWINHGWRGDVAKNYRVSLFEYFSH